MYPELNSKLEIFILWLRPTPNVKVLLSLLNLKIYDGPLSWREDRIEYGLSLLFMFIDKSSRLKQFKDVRDSIYVKTKYPDYLK